jgi:hypothetical protein
VLLTQQLPPPLTAPAADNRPDVTTKEADAAVPQVVAPPLWGNCGREEEAAGSAAPPEQRWCGDEWGNCGREEEAAGTAAPPEQRWRGDEWGNCGREEEAAGTAAPPEPTVYGASGREEEAAVTSARIITAASTRASS